MKQTTLPTGHLQPEAAVTFTFDSSDFFERGKTTSEFSGVFVKTFTPGDCAYRCYKAFLKPHSSTYEVCWWNYGYKRALKKKNHPQ